MIENDLFDFYRKQLKENILGFWLPRCEDKDFGGYLNCFDNRGEHLVSYDKYTWSQGRFLWLFSRLAATPVNIFSDAERAEFLRLAHSGADFLRKHCLIENEEKCVFLMDREGNPKQVSKGTPLDMSIYADCFAVIGMGAYSYATSDKWAFDFAFSLYESIKQRILSGDFRTLPYPLSPRFRAHGIPMILSNTARELLRASDIFDTEASDMLRKDIWGYSSDIIEHFVDRNDVLHEIITIDNEFFPQLLGQHQNPGHTIEDAWFHLDAALVCNNDMYKEKIFRLVKKTLINGWDKEYGGFLHFCGVDGGEPLGQNDGLENEPMSLQLSGWGDKLWWVHSESLYTTLRCYFESGNKEFLEWYEKIQKYVFSTFPNPDSSIGEWIQIRTRDGRPQEKVVALPVKDPFHIARNFLLILELLQDRIS